MESPIERGPTIQSISVLFAYYAAKLKIGYGSQYTIYGVQ